MLSLDRKVVEELLEVAVLDLLERRAEGFGAVLAGDDQAVDDFLLVLLRHVRLR